MKNDKNFYLSILATNKCNRGCKHCAASATEKGNKFVKPMWINKLVREAKELGLKVYGAISGLGEPLMHPQITKVARAFTGLKVCKEIKIITSGFLPDAYDEKERFRKLVGSSFSPIMRFGFSFNLYSPTFSKRLEETFGMLIRHRGASFSDINVVCDRNNYFKTFIELHEVLACMEVDLGIEILPLKYDYSDEYFKRVLPNFLCREYSEEMETELFGDSLLAPYIYRIESKKYGRKFFCMGTSMTYKAGLASRFSDDHFCRTKMHCKEVMEDTDGFALYMDPEGNIFPACNCVLQGLQIGTWRTPLKELLLRKSLLRNEMMGLVISDQSLKWGNDMCKECALLARRNFSFVTGK